MHNSGSLALNSRKQQHTILCNINARSVKNKTAEIVDYICETKADLVAVTEHWLTVSDSACRTELCPNGYKIVDHVRSDRRGGGTGLIFREAFDVKKVEAGVSDGNSYEFSEWLIKWSSHNLRIVIIYKEPYSVNHRVSFSVFLSEFPK